MKLPTVHHVFCKADPLGEKEVRSQVICLEADLPKLSLAMSPDEHYQMEADGIARILIDTLPQATLERLLANLLEHFAGLYRGKS